MEGSCAPRNTCGVMFVLLLASFLGSAVLVTGAGDAPNCRPGFFNENCTGVCHCLNGNDVCDNFGCRDYICDRGWTGAPSCNIECDPFHFGSDCRFTCHCRGNDTCNKVNGVCSSNLCDPDWAGSGCQIRLPKLVNAPEVVNVTCTTLTVVWSRWQTAVDIGNVAIGGYNVERRSNMTGWHKVAHRKENVTVNQYSVISSRLDNRKYYQFRVTAMFTDDDKAMPGLPGPVSKAAKPRCPVEPTTVATTEAIVVTTSTSTTSTTASSTTTPTTTTTATTTTTTTTTTTPTPTEPTPVQDIRVIQNATTRMVHVTWLEPVDVGETLIGYEFTYQAVHIGDCADNYNGPITQLSFQPTVTSYEVAMASLMAWTTYRLNIYAQNLVGKSEAATTEFTTPEIAPNGTVKNVRHSDVLATSATFAWDDVTCSSKGGGLVYFYVVVRDVTASSAVVERQTRDMNVQVHILQAYTTYGVKIRYVNSRGSGPLSREHTVTTKQAVPPAPRSVQVSNQSESTLHVTWLPPSPPNGVIKNYRVEYWPAGGDDGKMTPVQGVASGTSRVIRDLRPHTTYFIQVFAQTGAAVKGGWGNGSVLISHVTSDGKPSPPVLVERTFRNESCIGIRWTAPETPNGVVTGYKVLYRAVQVLSVANVVPDEQEKETPAQQRTLLVCSLLAAAKYIIKVKARTRTRYGDSKVLTTWTEVAMPTMPPAPTVDALSETTASITIRPVTLRGGPVSSYFLVVAPVSRESRRRRRRANPTTNIPLPGYTTAQLPADDVTSERSFTIGDNSNYGPYRNIPLEGDKSYTIYYVVASEVDGTTKMAFSLTSASRDTSRTDIPKTTTTSTKPPTTPPQTTSTTPVQAGGDNILLIVGVCVASFLLLLLLGILLVVCLYRKCQSPKPANLPPTWMDVYKNKFGSTTIAKPTPKWSDIYELNTSRFPIYDTSYSPDDLKVAEIYHNKPRIPCEDEYRKLPHKAQCTTEAAERSDNQIKNRFDHLLAYDHSRIVLRPPLRRDTDYVNANFIHGYNSNNAYIAAQSPFNEVTMCDFWAMVYQEAVSHIVFMARLTEDGIVKCEQYWPDAGLETYGLITVRHVSSRPYADFTQRTFDISANGHRTRRVTQYQFTAWPDHGTPEDPIPLYEFRTMLRSRAPADRKSGPLLVHCGTGVSRAAVFIAVDSLLEQAREEHVVNVFNFCNKMRRNRVMMVRTLKQYLFIYDVLFEALITTYNVVGADLKVNYRELSRTNPASNKSCFREQFEVLEEFVPPIDPTQTVSALTEANRKKNRFGTIVSSDRFRPILKTPSNLGRTDYINALYVDTYARRNGFIVTHTPLTNTVADLWKLVYDYNVTTIVSMNGSDFHEDSCVEYWPIGAATRNVEPFLVKPVENVEDDHMTVRSAELSCTLNPSARARVVRQFRFESWTMYDKVPWSREGFLLLLDAVNDWQRQSAFPESPILVHCMDGASQSGLYCACSILCEKMRVDGQVDVFHTIKRMKRRRPHFVNSLEQYKFCFKTLWDFMNTRLPAVKTLSDSGSSHWSHTR